MILALAEAKATYECEHVYEVVDVDAEEPWFSTTPFSDLPEIKMTTSLSDSGLDDDNN